MHPVAKATPSQKIEVAEPSLFSAPPVRQSRLGEVDAKPTPPAEMPAQAVEGRE